MRRYLREYLSEFEEALNIPLMNKEADLPLVEYVKDAWKSLEIVKNIRIDGFEYTEDESQININDFIFKREKKRRKKDRYNYKYIKDDRCGCLTVHITISVDEIDPKTNKPLHVEKKLTKRMLIPLQDEDGYYFIKGKKFYAIYQLVDKSSYTSSSTVTLKSLMPIAVRRNSFQVENFVKSTNVKSDTRGIEYNLPVYSVFVFKKEIPVILFYLANGAEWALDYLGVYNILHFVESYEEEDEKNLYFQISSKCFIKVNKELFLKYPYIQSIVGGLLFVSTNRITMEDINTKEIWVKKLSNNNTLEKGQDILVFFNRLLDETTKKILMLSDHNKTDVYAILRWMMQNYNALRLKDNLAMDNKRLRCNEYIASLLTYEFSKRLNRIITLGNKATIKNYIECFKFPGDMVLCLLTFLIAGSSLRDNQQRILYVQRLSKAS